VGAQIDDKAIKISNTFGQSMCCGDILARCPTWGMLGESDWAFLNKSTQSITQAGCAGRVRLGDLYLEKLHELKTMVLLKLDVLA